MKSNLKYWDWMAKYRYTNAEGEYVELPAANPDVLSETSYPWEYERDDDHDEAVKEIVDQLQLSKREAQILTLMQQGATHRQVGSILKMPRGNVSKYIMKVRGKVKEIVRQNPDLAAMVRGIIN